jgi:hypothetical protein
LSEAALALLDDAVAPRDFIQLLLARSRSVTEAAGGAEAGPELELEPDAIRLLAYALPVREAVWWAWVSARRVAGDAAPPGTLAALAAAEAWIAKPTDGNRRAALQRAEEDGGASAGGLVALAAGLSGGSLAPADLAEVPPPPYSAAKAITGAVIIAAVQDPAAAPELYREFVTQGCEVADRINLWKQFPAPTPRS